jgi:hypothetical protein
MQLKSAVADMNSVSSDNEAVPPQRSGGKEVEEAGRNFWKMRGSQMRGSNEFHKITIE